MSLRVHYRLSFTPDFREWPKSTLRKGMERANSVVGQFWHRHLLIKHFRPGADREYAYERRQKQYQIDKAKAEGSTRALVGITRAGHRAGTLQRSVLRTGLVTASATRVTVRMQAPTYAKRRSRGGSGPDLVAEITAISDQDTERIVTIYERAIARFMDREPKKREVRSGS